MNNLKNKKDTFKKCIKQSFILSGMLGVIMLYVLLLYKTMDTPIERFVVIMLGIFLLIPTVPIIITFLIHSIINVGRQPNVDQKNNSSFNANVPKPKSTTTEQTKPNLKVVTTQGYTEFNNILKASVQNKLMNRQSILQLKCELIYRLGTHIEVYKNFQFQNDLHEIYTLSKSSVLTKDDYEYLTQFISNNLNLSKEA